MRKLLTISASLGLPILLLIETKTCITSLDQFRTNTRSHPYVLTAQAPDTIQSAITAGIGNPPNSSNAEEPTPIPTPLPTPSPSLSQTPIDLSGQNLTISDTLAVLGNSLLGKTTIAGGLSVDGTVAVNTAGIQSMGDTLAIQSEKLAPVSIMDGALTVDTNGNVSIPSLTVNVLGVSTIKPTEPNLTIQLSTDSAHFNSLLVTGVNGATVAGITSQGNLSINGTVIASGSGVFGNVKTSSITTHNLFLSSGPPGTNEDPVGASTIPTGYKDMIILNNLVTSSSHIFVSPVTVTNLPLAVTDVKPKTPTAAGSFTVSLPSATPVDIDFNWFILNQTP